MDEQVTKRSLDLLIALSRASKVTLEALYEAIDSYGVNSTEFAVLELLYHKGPQPIQRVGQKILMQSGSLTYVVKQLEKKGYVQRERCATDRRVFYVSNTKQGDDFIRRVFPEHEKRVVELMSALSADEQQQLTQLLKKLGHSIQTIR